MNIYIFPSLHNDVTTENHVRLLYSFLTLNKTFDFNGIIIMDINVQTF
jgi:hypothetical protein